jgi:tRNA nucleotidyltransferase/poly(A) polymerase
MLLVKSSNLNKSAALPADISLPLDGTEERIFAFIRQAIGVMPKAPVARVAGGWVRDKLLGKPSKDIDITVEGTTGTEFANSLRRYAIETQGQNQKIVSRVKDTEARPEQIKNLAVAFLRIFGQEIEILGIRGKEVYLPGSRNPIYVDKEPTPEEDALRRDLTINSLFYNINTGRVEDFTGKGYDDLLTMTLRTPIDPIKTFQDDPLRVLRILRFHSRYPNSKIAPEAVEAMKDTEVQHQITRRLITPDETAGIVPERTAEELRKLMVGAQPEAALRVMYQTGLLQKMFNLPENFHPLHMDQRSSYHSLSVIEHTLNVVRNVNNLAEEFGLSTSDRMFLNMASLFHDLGKLDPRSHKMKPDGTIGYSGDPSNADSITHEQSSLDIWENFAKTLRLSDKERTTIGAIVSGHMYPHAHIENAKRQTSDRTFRRYIRKNPLWAMQYIHAMADAMSKDTEPNPAAADPYRANFEHLKRLEPTVNTFGQSGPRNDLINGRRIIELLGLDPKTGYIEFAKEAVRELQDENPSLTPQEAEQHLLTMLAQGEFDRFKR